jgi:hypothetical protein
MRIIKPMQILIKPRLQILPLPLEPDFRINRLSRFRMRFQAGVIFGFAIHLMLCGPDFPPGLMVIQRFRGAEVVGFDIEYAEGLVDDG